jgi:uncharacterized protein YdaU (DUF1376 family)
MSDNTFPMMPWFPRDFMSSTRGWPLIAKAVYRELLDAQWDMGSLPGSQTDLKGISGASDSEWEIAWPKIETKFPIQEDGSRKNFRLEEHRIKSQQLSKVRSEAAKKGNEARWQTYRKRIANGSHPSPSPSPLHLNLQNPSKSKSKNGGINPPYVEQKLDDVPVQRVFDHWRTEFQHPRAVLDAKRKRVIQAALKAFDEATLLIAISGYRNSPHHMGENEARTVYDDITLFLRDANHIENGLRFSRGPPAPAVSAVTRARQKLQESINANRRVVSEQTGSSQGSLVTIDGVLRGFPDSKI